MFLLWCLWDVSIGQARTPCQNILLTQGHPLSLESTHQILHSVPLADVPPFNFLHKLYRPLFDQYTPAIEELQQTGGLPYGTPSRDNTYSIML